MYANGEGVIQDYKEAVRWFKKAAKQGHAAAQTNLARMYYKGQSVRQDYSEAVKWYRKSAEQGYTGAQYHLGEMYETGKGVPINLVMAHMFYNLAVANGYKEGLEEISKVAGGMTASQLKKAERLAREWTQKHQ